MKVEFYRVDDDAKSVKVGDISLVDGRLKPSNDNLGLQRVLERESVHGKTGEWVSRDDPEKFLRALCYEYSGVYFRASQPIE